MVALLGGLGAWQLGVPNIQMGMVPLTIRSGGVDSTGCRRKHNMSTMGQILLDRTRESRAGDGISHFGDSGLGPVLWHKRAVIITPELGHEVGESQAKKHAMKLICPSELAHRTQTDRQVPRRVELGLPYINPVEGSEP